MAVYDCFKDYREEIELSCVQNHGIELELYSIIASIIREYCVDISLRDVSARKRIKNDSLSLEGEAGFPDFVVLNRSKENPVRLGCIEAKNTYEIYDDHNSQISKHLSSFRKVLYTNGLEWRFLDQEDESNNWQVVLGYRSGESLTQRKKNSINWNQEDSWNELITLINKLRWEKHEKKNA